MIDAENLLFIEMLMQDSIQQARALDIFTKGLFHYDPMPSTRLVQASLIQLRDDSAEIRRLDGQIEHRIGA